MATKAKKTGQAKTTAAPAKSAASKDNKKAFGTAAPKSVKPAVAAKTSASKAKPEQSTTAKPSMARRMMRKVAQTATSAVSGAVAAAASVVGKSSKPAKTKGK